MMKASDVTGREEETWESLYWRQREINSRERDEAMEVGNSLSLAEGVRDAGIRVNKILRAEVIRLEELLENALHNQR